MERQQLIRNIKTYFDSRTDVVIALLYGSQAKGTANANSDIDIAIHTEQPTTPDQLVQIQTDISQLCGAETDIADLRNAEGIFLHQIIKSCIRIKYEPELYSYYTMKAIYFYEDFLPLIRRMQKKIIGDFVNGQ